jgi:hypothetical protein
VAATDEPANHPPIRPTNVAASATGSDAVEITWSATSDPDGDAVEYFIEEVYDVNINSGWLDGSTTSWTATGLAPGTTYKFQIRARDDRNPPAYSPWARANTVVTGGEATSPPRDPSDVTATTVSATAIEITWTNNGHPEDRPVAFYVEELADPTITSGWLPEGTTTWTASGLEPSTTYTFSVRARDDQDPPHYSGVVSSNPATTDAPPNEPPYDPANVAATALGATSVRVTWTNGGDPEGQSVEFLVREVGNPARNSGWLPSGTTAWTAGGLSPETTYRFEAQARDNGSPRGFSGWVASNEATTTAVPNQIPRTPTNVVAASAGPSAITISWTDNGDPDGDPVEYTVRDLADPARTSGWLSAGITTWTAVGLEPLTAYRFEVQGRDDGIPPLTTPWVPSNLATTGETPNEAPGQVTDVVATVLNSSSVRVNWGPSVDPNGDPVQYEARVASDPSTTSGWLPSGTLEWQVVSLQAETNYSFEVRSRDDGDPPLTSAWVSSNAVTTYPSVIPPPSEPVPVFDENTIVLQWPESADPRVVGYHVYRLREGGAPERLTTTPHAETRFEDDAIEDGLGYFYWVTAVDSEEQESPPSGNVWIRATPHVPPRAFLEKAFPSPIRDEVTFRLGIPETGPGSVGARVSVDLYDLAGKKVGRVLDETIAPGMREVTWRVSQVGPRLVPGLYVAVVRAAGQTLVERVAYAGR